MLKHNAVVLLMVAGSFVPLHAQFWKKANPFGKGGAGASDGRQMQAAMEDAQKNAKRPGDDSLTCDALQNELVATVQDPAVQSVMQKQGAWGKEQQEKLDEARANSGGAGSTAGQLAAGFIAGFVPGFGAARSAAQNAQMHRQMQQAAANQEELQQRMQEMMTIMPQLMRAQRVSELAQRRKCDWIQAPGALK